MKEYITHSPEETEKLGETLAEQIKTGDIIALYGELGSGKTCFIRGFCRKFGISEIKSPSFVLINQYQGKDFPIWHIDLYRIEEPAEIAELGLEEIFGAGGIALIEWAEKAGDFLPEKYWKVELFFHPPEENTRIIKITPAGKV